MTQLSEQLSAVRKAQLETQLDVFRTLTNRALDSAGQIAALNMRVSRASIEQAAGTMKHLLEVRDPRDLFAVGSAAQGQWQALFSYGRELFGIAVGARVPVAPVQLLAAPAPTANIPASYSQVMEQASIAVADAATITGEIATISREIAADTGAALADATIGAVKTEPAAPVVEATEQAAPAAAAEAAVDTAIDKTIDTAIADDTPPAKAKPLAEVLNEVAPKPAAAEHPIASTVPLEASGTVELPPVAPLESAAPPPKASRGPRKK
jgi:hypothetical protein